MSTASPQVSRPATLARALGNLPNGGGFDPTPLVVDVSVGKSAVLYVTVTTGNGAGAYALLRVDRYQNDGATAYPTTVRDVSGLTLIAGVGYYGLLEPYYDRLFMPAAATTIRYSLLLDTRGCSFMSFACAEVNGGGVASQVGLSVVPQYEGSG